MIVINIKWKILLQNYGFLTNIYYNKAIIKIDVFSLIPHYTQFI